MTPVSITPPSLGTNPTAVNVTGVQAVDLTPLEIVRDGTMTVAQAAAETGLSARSIYRLLEAGSIRYVRLCGRRLIPRRLLHSLLAAHLTEAGQ